MIVNIFCKELNNFYFSIDENECKDVEYLDEKVSLETFSQKIT